MTTPTSINGNIALSSEADIHETAVIGIGTVIRGRVTIGPNVHIGSNCVIDGTDERQTVINAGCVLDDMIKIHPGVSLGANSSVGLFSVLGNPSKVVTAGADGALGNERVRKFVIDEPFTEIGANAVIRSHAVIYSNVVIGDEFSTGHFIMVREHTRIGDRCVFGTHASVDGYTSIGDRTHVGQYAQLSQSATIGRGVFIGGQTVFSDNIKAIWDVEQDLFGATLGDYVRIGLNCTVLPKVVLERGAFIGAGSIVTKDVPKGGLAFGAPAKMSRTQTAEEIQEYIDSVEA